MKPKRITLSRKKGWRMPANTVKVCRPGYFGNPFKVGRDGDAATCVLKFAAALVSGKLKNFPFYKRRNVGWKVYLRGKNLACWCKPGQPCHADVLLEIVNR